MSFVFSESSLARAFRLSPKELQVFQLRPPDLGNKNRSQLFFISLCSGDKSKLYVSSIDYLDNLFNLKALSRFSIVTFQLKAHMPSMPQGLVCKCCISLSSRVCANGPLIHLFHALCLLQHSPKKK